MEGSRIMGKGTWKQSIIRDIPSTSRIFSTDKELPSKFSPAHVVQQGNDTKSLLKFRTNAYSQDEINMQDLKYQQTRREFQTEEKTPLMTPRSSKMYPAKNSLGSLRRNSSHKSTEIKKIQAQGLQQFALNFQKSDAKVIKQLKQEFIQFKDKVLKELRRREIELNQIITQIYKLVHQNKSNLMHIQKEDHIPEIKISSLSINFPKVQSYQQQNCEYFLKSGNIATKVSQIETTKYKTVFSEEQNNSETVIPKIKQSINKFMSLITRLKEDISNDPYSKIQSAQIQCDS